MIVVIFKVRISQWHFKMEDDQDIFSAISFKNTKEAPNPDKQPQLDGSGTGKLTKVRKPNSAKAFAKLNKLTTDGFKEMNATIKDGFTSMRESFLELGSKFAEAIGEKLDANNRVSHVDYEDEYSEEEERQEDGLEEEEQVCETENDVFEKIAGAKEDQEAGPAVQANLAKMMDKLLIYKLMGKEKEEKVDKYKRPQNVSYAKVPKTNPPIFDTLRVPAKRDDKHLQLIQSDVVKSSIPICQVMENLFQNKDTPSEIDAVQLIKTLSDSLNFIGSANVELVKMRKNIIKKELPSAMQGLCKEPESFSANFLFGDELNSKIKEVTELNKVKKQFDFPSSIRGNFRGAGRGRGRGGPSFRGYSRDTGRYRPYSRSKNFRRGGNQTPAPKKQ